MTKRNLPTIETLRNLLRYEPDTGRMFWRVRDVRFFRNGAHTAAHSCANWNAQYAGKQAFTATDGDGYLHGSIFGKMYRAHRIIFAMVAEGWPKDQIDHEDHDRSNNRFDNLREATNQENGKNQRMPATNTSGHIGVYWVKRDSRWRAQIKTNGKSKHLGCFTAIKDAIAAREAANLKYGFHKNHGC